MGACPRCATEVALHEGTPLVSAAGAVELWHPSCLAVRHARPVEQVTVVAQVAPVAAILTASIELPRRHPALALSCALALVSVGAGGAYALRAPQRPVSLAAISIEPTEDPSLRTTLTEREVAPAAPDDRDRFPIPAPRGTPLDESYPSLSGWIHPVVSSEQALSTFPTGMFGAERDGVMRRECGDGHCGIDLAGPIGRPIVAVAPGVVVKIERSEMGRDGRSGRYVRLEHPDGAITAYMHLNAIARGLEVGDRVDAGQQIGTLGTTGIRSGSPHVHFSLEIPRVAGTHGDHTNTTYVDPAPFLVRGRIIEAADRRRAEKPAW